MQNPFLSVKMVRNQRLSAVFAFTHFPFRAFDHSMDEEREQLVLLRSDRWQIRVAIVIAIIFAFAFGWFSVRWQIGNMLAGLTSPSDSDASDIARTARSFAPLDPSASWLTAVTEAEVFSPSQLQAAVRDHRYAVRLSPYHYFWWLELGRAYEQTDNAKGSEMALKRAVELAPTYTLPRWQLGNFYLRQGNDQAAFPELKKAADSDQAYREQVFSILWDYLENDPKALEAVVGDSPDTRVGLAKFYAMKEKPALSLEKWRSIDASVQKEHHDVGALIAQAFFEKRYLKTAVEFVKELSLEPDVKFGSIQNPGFEKEISSRDPVFFGWKIQPVENARVLLSRAKKKSGNRSIQITFSGYEKAEFNDLYQTVALEPGAEYELGFWLKTEDIRSAGTPKLEVLSAVDNKIIAASDPMETGSADWKYVKIRFTVPENSEGVVIRTARAYCGEKCPLFGTIWYDDFKLTKIEDDQSDG
jgi:tetratricopeptide (TPR) repeat protein